MKLSLPFCIVLPAAGFFFSCIINLCLAVDSNNLQDTCPAAVLAQQTIFFNGYPCKNPANVTASDFKSSKLNQAGDTDNVVRSSTAIVTAAGFPGLNTLGLAVGRTDLDVDGLVMPHSHPRASEMFFVNVGVVIVGFIDTQNNLFQKTLRAGDVFVFPRGLLHYVVNGGFEPAVAFSVLNSQNPGLASISGAMFLPRDSRGIDMFRKRLISISSSDMERDATLFGF